MEAARRLEEILELGEEIGRGGFGVVHRARSRRDGRLLAVKIAHPDTARAQRERILREASLLASFRHPRVAGLDRVVDDPERGLALVYQYVTGRTLADARREGPPAMLVFLSWLSDLAAALGALHQAGIVHRDVKPENVIVEVSGQLKLLDFGIARPLDAGATVTGTGIVMGTPGFIPPEVFHGARTTQACDLYGLGALLFWMVEGHPPFEGAHPMDILRDQESGTLPSMRAWGGDAARLEPALSRILAPDPAARPADVAGLVAEVHAALAERAPPPAEPARDDPSRTLVVDTSTRAPGVSTPRGIAATPVRSPGPSRGRLRARRRRAVALGIPAVLALAAVVALWPRRGDAPAPAASIPTEPASPAEPRPEGPIGPALVAAMKSELAAAGGVLVGPRGEPLDPAAPPADPRDAEELLSRDYLRWRYLLPHLPALGRLHAWLAEGNHLDALSLPVREGLAEVDQRFRDQDLPPPLEPYLAVGPPPEAGPYPARVLAEWAEWKYSGTPSPELPPRSRQAIEEMGRALRLFDRRTREIQEDPERLQVFRAGASPLLRTVNGLVAFAMNSSYSRPLRVELARWFEDGRVALHRAFHLAARAAREEPDFADEVAVVVSVLLPKGPHVFLRTILAFEPPEALLGGPGGPGAAPSLRLLHAAFEAARFRSLSIHAGEDTEGRAARAAWLEAYRSYPAASRGWAAVARSTGGYSYLESFWKTPECTRIPEVFLAVGDALRGLDTWRRTEASLKVLLMLAHQGEPGGLAGDSIRELVALCRAATFARSRLMDWSTSEMVLKGWVPQGFFSLEDLLAEAERLAAVADAEGRSRDG